MLLNMQTKSVYVMFYNYYSISWNSYIFIILQNWGEEKYFAFCHVFNREYTLFWVWAVGFLDGWEVGYMIQVFVRKIR